MSRKNGCAAKRGVLLSMGFGEVWELEDVAVSTKKPRGRGRKSCVKGGDAHSLKKKKNKPKKKKRHP